MCGRFTLRVPATKLQESFPLFDLSTITARYNIAPTQSVLAVRQRDKKVRPEGTMMRWGLIPFWAGDKKIGNKLINARAESVASKPAFREAFRQRRCLVIADGFYEWQKHGSKKVPHHIRFRDGRPFAFAGLWERWKKEEPAIESCTVITTDANELVRPLHDRMPVVLHPEDYARWLDPAPRDPAALEELLRPCESDELVVVPVNDRVNNVGNDDAACLEEQATLF